MKTLVRLILGALLGIALLPYLLFRQPDMPQGADLASQDYAYAHAELLIDQTAWDAKSAKYVQKQEIFDSILREIRDAETFIVADFFLWNPWSGAVEASGKLRPLSVQLADALIAKRIQNPDMPIVVLTDPINRIYGDQAPSFYQRLSASGIPVVFTELSELPDSNKLYAPQAEFWRHFIDWGEAELPRLAPNPFDKAGEKLTLPQLGQLLYFKANHRKVLVTGRSGDVVRLIVTSFNPADGSANHSNIGALVQGPVAVYAAASELAVAEWSSAFPANVNGGLALELFRNIKAIRARLPDVSTDEAASSIGATVAWRSEGAIRDELVVQLNRAGRGTRVDAGVFYFSDRPVVQAMEGAIRRGAQVRLLLDANRDAFGREKNGIPNRPVAAELMAYAGTHSVDVRWASTHGEQYHAKVLRVKGPAQDVLFLGSANWTRRNIGNLNLEANLLFKNAGLIGTEFDTYYESLWSNSEGWEQSLPYGRWAESGWALRWKTWMYRFQEWSGVSAF